MSDTDAGQEHQDKKVIGKLETHLIKSNLFRVIHVDGAWGGITPSGNNVQMALFSHRTPIPEKQYQPVFEDKTVGGEIQSENVAKSGIVREIESVIIFDLEVAKSIREWLDGRIKNLEIIRQQRGQPK